MSNQLLVGPFPLSVERGSKEKLLQHFGAISTVHKKKHQRERYIIGKFKSFQDCERAMQKIHQMIVLRQRITAKYYFADDFHLEPHEKSIIMDKDKVAFSSKVKNALRKYEVNIGAICSRFDATHPISPLLRYKYPPATMEVIDNISHALMTSPKFYTQVLHLMNKMNLPCPFQEINRHNTASGGYMGVEGLFMSTKLKIDPCNNTQTKTLSSSEVSVDMAAVQNMSESETSSEIESDEDWKQKKSSKSNVAKRVRKHKSTINKRMKLDDMKKALSENVDNQRSKENVAIISDSAKNAFELAIDVQKSMKMEVKLQSSSLCDVGERDKSSLEIVEPVSGDIISGFGKIFPSVQDSLSSGMSKDDDVQGKTKSNYIELKELKENRISKSDWPMLSVFKNYTPGNPSRKLYLKNIAKTVTEGDLKYIFGRFVCWEFIDEVTNFTIQLMRGGRMKGQGFITFLNEETAVKALNETNGYILKDKPIVVMYAKINKDSSESKL